MVDTSSTLDNDADGENSNSQTPLLRPRILLTGLRRSGKTSIQRVIFTKMQPSQTQFLESTPQLTLSQHSCGSFINFQVQELPGQLHTFPSANTPAGTNESSTDDKVRTVGTEYDIAGLLKRCNAVVYIIDAQDDYAESISRLNMIIQLGRSVNSKIRYEVFIHKVDQLSEDGKIETQRDIHNQVRDRFADPVHGVDVGSSSHTLNPNSQDILINFHLTSIFDHSIFEAFSKVIQKLIPEFGHLEHLLTYLLSASNIEQAFLFDVQTKISIANDSSPTDMQMYELCCDMIDLLISMSEIYGQPNDHEESEEDESDRSMINDGQSDDLSYSSLVQTTDQPASNVFDSMSSSVIKLTGGRVLYLKEINRHLALICVLREEALIKQALIDYNVKQLKESIMKLFQLNQQK